MKKECSHKKSLRENGITAPENYTCRVCKPSTFPNIDKENMNIETPQGWRKGQTIFNFLCWLRQTKRYDREYGLDAGRMADPFHIPDDIWDSLYEEFLSE